ncbi:MAG: hypothetical protein U0U66_03930 [Cytophagaceae bacterium]
MVDFEKSYYPIVAKFLEKKYQCFLTALNTGLKHSRADVIGIRDIGGDLTGEIETIIVEVKRGAEAFATSSGQCFGYTVYANRVFLADKRDEGFTEEEIQIANHLGIGLIQIDKKNKCSVTLSSPYYKPMTKLNTSLLEKMKLGKCQLCDSYVEIGEGKNRYTKVSRENFNKAIEQEKGLIFWNREIATRKENNGVRLGRENISYERRFLCSDCVGLFAQLLNK